MEPQSLRQFLLWKPEPLQVIIDQGIMYSGTKVIIYGKYKSLKSMLVTRLGLCLARGLPWLDFNTYSEGVSVLYLQLEVAHSRLQVRLRTMTEGDHTTLQPLIIWTQHFLKLDTEAGLKYLEAQLDYYKPQVLIVDPIYKVLSKDILDAHSVMSFLDNMDILIEKRGINIVLVSHAHKVRREDTEWGSDTMLGSVLFSNWADTIIRIERPEFSRVVARFDSVRNAKVDLGSRSFMVDESLAFIREVPPVEI